MLEYALFQREIYEDKTLTPSQKTMLLTRLEQHGKFYKHERKTREELDALKLKVENSEVLRPN